MNLWKGAIMSVIQLKKIMKQKKIGNKALAEASGIPIGTLNKIIYGETTNPSLDTMKALSIALDCTLDDLLNDNFEQGHYIDHEIADIAQELYDRPELKTLFSTTRKVSKEDMEVISKLIDKFADDKE